MYNVLQSDYTASKFLYSFIYWIPLEMISVLTLCYGIGRD